MGKPTWTVPGDDRVHMVVYQGKTFSGNAKVTIDGMYYEATPISAPGIGALARFKAGGREVILRLPARSGELPDLAIDGIFLGSGLAVDASQALACAPELGAAQVKTRQKMRAGRTSFLTMIVLTVVNMFLLVADTTFSFPFSAIAPQLVFGIGFYGFQETGAMPLLVICGAATLLMLGVYLLLYFLSAKYVAASWIALILFTVDTAILIFLSVGNATNPIIDLILHAWVLWALGSMIHAQHKLNRFSRDVSGAQPYVPQ